MKKLTLILFLLLAFQPFTRAQFLKNLQNSIQNKVQQRIEDKLVDVLSDAVSNALESQIDSLLKNEYKKSIGLDSTDDVDWAENQDAFSDFLDKMNVSAEDLPPAYSFDLQVHQTYSSHNQKPQHSTLLYTSSGRYFGIQDKTDHNQSWMVMDIEKEQLILYTIKENGKKTAQILPSSLILKVATLNNGTPPKYSKTGRTRSIAGYLSHEWIIEDEKSTSHVWVAPDFPVRWKEAYGSFIQKFLPKNNRVHSDQIKGIALEVTIYDKGKDEHNYQSTTTSVSNTTFTISNSDFTFGGMGE